MEPLNVNRHQKAAADLALLGLKHTSDKVVSQPATSLASTAQAARLAAEARNGQAHAALAALVTDHHEETVDACCEAADTYPDVNVIDDGEIEIRIGSRTVHINVV